MSLTTSATGRPFADLRTWIHLSELASVQGSVDDGPAHDREVTALVDYIASAISAVFGLAARLDNESFRHTDNEGVPARFDSERAPDVANEEQLSAAGYADITVSRTDLHTGPRNDRRHSCQRYDAVLSRRTQKIADTGASEMTSELNSRFASEREQRLGRA